MCSNAKEDISLASMNWLAGVMYTTILKCALVSNWCLTRVSSIFLQKSSTYALQSDMVMHHSGEYVPDCASQYYHLYFFLQQSAMYCMIGTWVVGASLGPRLLLRRNPVVPGGCQNISHDFAKFKI